MKGNAECDEQAIPRKQAIPSPRRSCRFHQKPRTTLLSQKRSGPIAKSPRARAPPQHHAKQRVTTKPRRPFLRAHEITLLRKRTSPSPYRSIRVQTKPRKRILRAWEMSEMRRRQRLKTITAPKIFRDSDETKTALIKSSWKPP